MSSSGRISKASLTALIWLLLLQTTTALAGSLSLPFYEAGKRYSVNPLILYAIAVRESSLNPYCIYDNGLGKDFQFKSWKQAQSYIRKAIKRRGPYPNLDIGIMQINWRYWGPRLTRLGWAPEDLLDYSNNISVGAWIFAHNLRVTRGNYHKALQLYRGGSKALRKPMPQAIKYADDVMSIFLATYKRLANAN